MPPVDLAAYGLMAALALAIPLSGPLERRFYGSDPATPPKLVAYGILVAVMWALTAVAVRISGWERLVQAPALGAAWPSPLAIAGLGLGVAAATYFALALMPLAQSLRGPRWRRAYAAAVRRNFKEIPGLLPNTAIERCAFALLSLSAGVCEEVLYRGFLIRFLHDGAAPLPLAAALLVSSLIFGLGHVYQGLKGVLMTAIAGFGLGLLFLISGSLIPVMVLHALLDLQMVYVLAPIRGDADAAGTELA